MDVCLFGGEITYLSCIRCHLLRLCTAINIKHKASNHQRKRNFKPLYVAQSVLRLESLITAAVLQELLELY